MEQANNEFLDYYKQFRFNFEFSMILIELNITTEDRGLIEITKGNVTNSYKGSTQKFSFGGESVFIDFSAYY